MEFIVTVVLLSITIVLGVALLFKKQKITASINDDSVLLNFQAETKRNIDNLYNSIKMLNDSQLELIRIYNSNVVDNIKNISTLNEKYLKDIADKLTELTLLNERKMDKLVQVIEQNLNRMLENNDKKLEEMRITVGEKLDTSLEKRLNESFALISGRLEAVSTGLGEMKSLATGVGDLKKVLTNVKTRGTFGEVQLGTLLEQMLAPSQYAEQVMLKEDSTERVDYVIYLPGKDGQNLLLPIDAKFPVEDYLRLLDELDHGTVESIQATQKALERRVKEESKKIREKYINVPLTTDFAILYLPTEGLYSEILKRTGLFEELQRDRITVCGPTTLSALLNSLQMGFKTLAIEKRSAEIWNLLSMFKKEFTTYVELLGKTQKKINEASDTIDSATKKSAKIQKQLSRVADIEGDGDAGQISGGEDNL